MADLRGAKLEARKSALADLLGRTRRAQVRLSDHIVGKDRTSSKACDAGAEGIVAKLRDSTYRGTRTTAQVKCLERRRSDRRLHRAGWLAPGRAAGRILEDDELRYAGKVGTGFTERSLRELHAKLTPLERATPAFADPPRGAEARGVHWVEPKRVAEVEFTELTGDHRLRHPTFRGLREDKPAKDVVLERPLPIDAKPARGGAKPARGGAKSAHSDAKPARGDAKPPAQLPAHQSRPCSIPRQESPARFALYYVRRRSLPRRGSSIRWPAARRDTLLPKHARGQPKSILLVDRRQRLDYTYVHDVEDCSASRDGRARDPHLGSARDPELPDLLVFDLDPHEDVSWKQVVEAAELLRGLFSSTWRLSSRPLAARACTSACPSSLDWLGRSELRQSVAEACSLPPQRYVATMSKPSQRQISSTICATAAA
jgi:bifunctional non-homologous end joining protein LigD